MNVYVDTDAERHEKADLDPRRWRALAVLLLANFMNLIDVTIVNVALPSIRNSTGAGFAALQWVVAGYVLMLGLGLLPGGRLGDRFGHKPVFLAGVALFTAASALCALAPDAGVLVAGRLIQGAGAALMVPQVLAIIHVAFAEDERGKAFGLAGAISGLAVIVGPVLGGSLIALDIGGLAWRWIFLVNIPVGLFAIAAGARLVPGSSPRDRDGFDVPGVALAAAAVVLVLYPLIHAGEHGWSLPAAVAIVAAVPVAGLFVWLQQRREARGAATLFPPRLFRNRSYSVGLALAFAFFSGVAGFFMAFAVFLQSGLGHSALGAGLLLLPFALGAFVASAGWAASGRQAGRGPLATGTVTMAAGMAMLLVVLRYSGGAFGDAGLVVSLAIAGLGMGLFVVNMFDAALSDVPMVDAGAASGLLHTKQQLGNTFGVALVGAIFFGTLSASAAYGPAIERALWFEVVLYLGCTVLALMAPRRGEGIRRGR